MNIGERGAVISGIGQSDVGRRLFRNPLDLTLWSIIVFLLILGVLWKFAWKPILAGLQTRENTIRESLEQAERTRREAMELQAKFDTQLKEASGKIAALAKDKVAIDAPKPIVNQISAAVKKHFAGVAVKM